MDRLSEMAGMELPKGAGSKVDDVAAKILLRNDEETLKSMTKWHFANTRKAMEKANKKECNNQCRSRVSSSGAASLCVNRLYFFSNSLILFSS